jgi:hypothetical protein
MRAWWLPFAIAVLGAVLGFGAARAQTFEEPELSFVLRTPPGWSGTRKAEGGVTTWSLRNPAKASALGPNDLIAVTVSALPRTPGRDPEEEFRGFVANLAKKVLHDGTVEDFRAATFGARDGFAASARGRIDMGAGLRPASARVLLMEVGDTHVLVSGISHGRGGAALADLGTPGGIFAPAEPLITPAPDDVPDATGMAADDPARALGDGETQTVTLLGPDTRHAALKPYAAQVGNIEAHLRSDPTGVSVDGPGGDRFAIAGLHTTEALVWLDRFTAGAETTLVFRFDPRRTTGVVLGVSGQYNLMGNEPNNPRLLLHWRGKPDGKGAARIVRDYDAVANLDVAASVPAEIRLVLTPAGGRFVAAGLPDQVVPWAPLMDGQGLRIYVYAQPETPQQPSRMALTGIELIRKAGTPSPTAPPPAGVAALATETLFAGAATPGWEVAGQPGLDLGKGARFGKDGLAVDLTAKPGAWANAGLLSREPAVVVDDRIEATVLETAVEIDPKRSDGLLVMLAWARSAEMWGANMAAAAALAKPLEGPFAGRWVLSLRTGIGPYAVWERPIDAAFVETAWNGRMILENRAGAMSVRLDGGPRVSGGGFTIQRGSKLFMAAYSCPQKDSVAARVLIKKITRRWIEPSNMTAVDRWRFVDDTSFDAKGFLNDLAKEVD